MGYDIPSDHHQSLPREIKREEKMKKERYFSDEHIASILYYLAEACNKNAVEHGFWEDEDKFFRVIELREKFMSEDSIKKLKDRIISLFNSEKIALEMSELAERLETLRKDPEKKDEHCPEFLDVEIEVVDLIIRAL